MKPACSIETQSYYYCPSVETPNISLPTNIGILTIFTVKFFDCLKTVWNQNTETIVNCARIPHQISSFACRAFFKCAFIYIIHHSNLELFPINPNDSHANQLTQIGDAWMNCVLRHRLMNEHNMLACVSISLLNHIQIDIDEKFNLEINLH